MLCLYSNDRFKPTFIWTIGCSLKIETNFCALPHWSAYRKTAAFQCRWKTKHAPHVAPLEIFLDSHDQNGRLKRQPTNRAHCHNLSMGLDKGQVSHLELLINNGLKYFHSRIENRIISTNAILNTIGISDDDSCSLCHSEVETIVHLFWHCRKVQEFASK